MARTARRPDPVDWAADLVAEVVRFDAPADAVVQSFFQRHKALGPRERRVLADTVFAVLRHWALWRHLAQGGPGRAERRWAALAWKGEPAVLGASLSPPEQAWLAAARAVDSASLRGPLRHHLPEWLAAALQAQVGPQDLDTLAAALDTPAPLDLRVNAARARREAVRAALAAEGIACEPTPYSPWGLRVHGKPSLRRSAALRDGDAEVQDEGSQLLAALVGARRGETVVDFCAGAGGKTLALGAAMRNTGRIVACDVSAHRLAALAPRAKKAGLDQVHTMALAHERDDRLARLAAKADRVLVDAPCSGLGTLRRHPDLKWRQTPESIAAFPAQQLAVLRAASRLVKPGGRLVYATCSLLVAENEDVATAFEADGDFSSFPAEQALIEARVDRASELVAGGWLRLWPQRHGTDGFFAAVWHRR